MASFVGEAASSTPPLMEMNIPAASVMPFAQSIHGRSNWALIA
jgi:hypothetical protein